MGKPDTSHGGIDSGAVSNNMQEKELTLEASKYMYKRLEELGIPVKMTRTNDEYLPKDERIKRIKELYNNDPNTILISNHINAGNGEGAEVVYSLKNNDTFANMILNNIGEKGQIKRKVYQRRLPENPNLDYYYILRESGNLEPVLIEYGFIDNINDSKKLKNNLFDYVEGVVKAIAEYAGYEYSKNNNSTYIVQKGDTLYSISKKTGIPVDELKEINKLDSNIISIGQILNLEKNDKKIYIVKKGDSLWSISRKLGVDLDELIKINDLKNSNIYENQKLLIPTNDEIYIVQSGDTLWSISKKYNLSVEELKKLNNLNNNLLKIGQELKIKKVN